MQTFTVTINGQQFHRNNHTGRAYTHVAVVMYDDEPQVSWASSEKQAKAAAKAAAVYSWKRVNGRNVATSWRPYFVVPVGGEVAI